MFHNETFGCTICSTGTRLFHDALFRHASLNRANQREGGFVRTCHLSPNIGEVVDKQIRHTHRQWGLGVHRGRRRLLVEKETMGGHPDEEECRVKTHHTIVLVYIKFIRS